MDVSGGVTTPLCQSNVGLATCKLIGQYDIFYAWFSLSADPFTHMYIGRYGFG